MFKISNVFTWAFCYTVLRALVVLCLLVCVLFYIGAKIGITPASTAALQDYTVTIGTDQNSVAILTHETLGVKALGYTDLNAAMQAREEISERLKTGKSMQAVVTGILMPGRDDTFIVTALEWLPDKPPE